MNILYFDEIDSTNTYLKNHYEQLQDMSFVGSGYQSIGRGRKNRIWNSDKNKNLLFSFLIKDQELINKYQSVSIISAYSIIEILNEYHLNNIGLKWPNDIYVNDKKICGILLEAISEIDIKCLIVGIGLNVNQDIFPEDIIYPATSLFKELNEEIDIEELRKKVYTRLVLNMNKIKDDYDFYEDIKEYDYLRNKKARVMIGNEMKDIMVKGINEDYCLIINYDNEDRIINAGEISFHI